MYTKPPWKKKVIPGFRKNGRRGCRLTTCTYGREIFPEKRAKLKIRYMVTLAHPHTATFSSKLCTLQKNKKNITPGSCREAAVFSQDPSHKKDARSWLKQASKQA
jgi:hypothetical protein